jgi:hypothetical protein
MKNEMKRLVVRRVGSLTVGGNVPAYGWVANGDLAAEIRRLGGCEWGGWCASPLAARLDAAERLRGLRAEAARDAQSARRMSIAYRIAKRRANEAMARGGAAVRVAPAGRGGPEHPWLVAVPEGDEAGRIALVALGAQFWHDDSLDETLGYWGVPTAPSLGRRARKRRRRAAREDRRASQRYEEARAGRAAA